MSTGLEDVVTAAMQLSIAERATVVDRLLDTLSDGDGDDELLAIDDCELLGEIERRLADTSGSIPWSVLRDEG